MFRFDLWIRLSGVNSTLLLCLMARLERLDYVPALLLYELGIMAV